jgi:oxygen-independent coproporphyrinogen-3 oxidase
MNRAHNAQQADYSIKLSQDRGFENITIDLIYGTPTLTNDIWEQNLKNAIDLKIHHISSYALTIENNTPLFHLIHRKKLEKVDDSIIADQFSILMEVMDNNGYEQYEISNFSKPGFRSKHNASYWEGKSYLGIGPSAHSFDGKKRRWNISNNIRYLQGIHDEAPYFEEEKLSIKDLYNEYIMTGLRRIEGISGLHIRKTFGNDYYNFYSREMESINASFYTQKRDIIQLTQAGKLMADRIASELFITKK